MSQTTNSQATQPRSTKPLCNRIAVVFDFDETLAPDTFDELLKGLGLDVDQFREQRVQPLLEDGWDKVAARFYCLIQESHRRHSLEDKITKDYLVQFGQELQPYEGAAEMFEFLRQHVHHLNPEITIEFYVITGGIGEIARNCCIAPDCNQIWGCEFHYGENNEIEFLKRSISHTEKTRYLLQIAKGSGQVEQDGQAFAYRDAPQEDLHIPLSQMIYVGDGASDIPCFSLLNDEQGIAIGVYKAHTAQDWSQEVEVSESQRVVNLAPADYRQDSELMRSLVLSLESLCKQIAVRQLSVGE